MLHKSQEDEKDLNFRNVLVCAIAVSIVRRSLQSHFISHHQTTQKSFPITEYIHLFTNIEDTSLLNSSTG